MVKSVTEVTQRLDVDVDVDVQMRRLVWALAACCRCEELSSYTQTPNQLKRTILINYYVCVDNYR